MSPSGAPVVLEPQHHIWFCNFHHLVLFDSVLNQMSATPLGTPKWTIARYEGSLGRRLKHLTRSNVRPCQCRSGVLFRSCAFSNCHCIAISSVCADLVGRKPISPGGAVCPQCVRICFVITFVHHRYNKGISVIGLVWAGVSGCSILPMGIVTEWLQKCWPELEYKHLEDCVVPQLSTHLSPGLRSFQRSILHRSRSIGGCGVHCSKCRSKCSHTVKLDVSSGESRHQN